LLFNVFILLVLIYNVFTLFTMCNAK